MALCYRYVGETEAMRATLKEVQKELSRVWRLKHHLQGDSFSDWISNDPIGTTKAWGALLVSVYRHLIREIIKHPIKTFSDELPEDTFDLSHFSVNDFCKRLEAL